jgi:hypothetical protein
MNMQLNLVKRDIKIKYFLVIPFLVVCLSTFIAHQSGVSYTAFLPNLIGIILGTLIVIYESARLKSRSFILSLFILILFILSLFSSGMDNVHRWVSIGPLNLNVAMAFTPIILYEIFIGLNAYHYYSYLLAIITSFLFILQPDAGLATSFASAVIFLVISKKNLSLISRLVVGFVLSLLVLLSWLRHDPLPAVAHVESILLLFGHLGRLGIFVAIFSFCALIAPFLSIFIFGKNKELAISFLIYFIMSFVVTAFGHFPVPVFGAGVSSVIGWYFLLAFVSESRRDTSQE